jgi:hypothetical protein
MKKRHKDTAWGTESSWGKKWNSTHTHSRARKRKTSRRGKIADILRQCYAFVISQVGIVTWKLACNVYFVRARLTTSLSQCCGMPSPIGIATFLQQCRSSRYVIDHVYSRCLFRIDIKRIYARCDRLLFLSTIYLIKTFRLKILIFLFYR